MNGLNIRVPIKDGYEIRSLAKEEFFSLYEKFAAPQRKLEGVPVFGSDDAFLNDEERAKAQSLEQRLGQPFELNLAIFKGSEFVGWCWGRQEFHSSFYMVTSGILPPHRRQGLYGLLLKEVLRITTQLGFQTIYSRHTPDNISILIPKLKAGFVITSFEVSDVLGASVQLTFFANSTRRKWFDKRLGHLP